MNAFSGNVCGAVSRPSIVTTLCCCARYTTMNPPPPMPATKGSVTPSTAFAATAASTAFPPSRRIWMPARVASASTLATAPPVPTATDSFVGVGAAGARTPPATSAAASTPSTARSEPANLALTGVVLLSATVSKRGARGHEETPLLAFEDARCAGNARNVDGRWAHGVRACGRCQGGAESGPPHRTLPRPAAGNDGRRRLAADGTRRCQEGAVQRRLRLCTPARRGRRRADSRVRARRRSSRRLYEATVQVPGGGIGGIVIGVRGSTDLIVPIGNDPFSLNRPLQLPKLARGARCPVATSDPAILFSTVYRIGKGLGAGPVFPVFGTGATLHLAPPANFNSARWGGQKVLWL